MFFYGYLTRSVIILALASVISSPAIAGVMINKTRVIYHAKDKSATATLRNVTKEDYAVQVWVNGASDQSDEQVPFVATPALFRIAPSEDQIVKIIKLPENTLPKDRESVFYFNAQEIPTLKKNQNSNQLTIAIRTRIKMFYRPKDLEGRPADALTRLTWQRINRDGKAWLRATNHTPWHISFSEISFAHGGDKLPVADPAMLTPFSHNDYLLASHSASQQGKVSFSVINDYGGIKQQSDVQLR